jgi:predicted Zn-dependent protease with MMP-like domain
VSIICLLCHPQANKHFDKEAALREAQDVVKAKQITYNKDDFFDMMSCETLDKMGHMQGDGIQNRRNMQVGQQ